MSVSSKNPETQGLHAGWRSDPATGAVAVRLRVTIALGIRTLGPAGCGGLLRSIRALTRLRTLLVTRLSFCHSLILPGQVPGGNCGC